MTHPRAFLGLLLAALWLPVFPVVAQPPATIRLPPPQLDSGKPLMQALKLRHTTRDFSSRPLPEQVLSNLLWAAFGVNRPDTGKRTAPSAYNHQEIDIYVFLASGVYRYDAKAHALTGVLSGDLRAEAGTADFAKQAPLTLVYVADYTRAGKAVAWMRERYAYADTGFIGQNVYLFCASAGLGVVVHDSTDKPALAKRLGLSRDQQIILAHTVGYPKQ